MVNRLDRIPSWETRAATSRLRETDRQSRMPDLALRRHTSEDRLSVSDSYLSPNMEDSGRCSSIVRIALRNHPYTTFCIQCHI